MSAYAEGGLRVARVDVDSVPQDPAGACGRWSSGPSSSTGCSPPLRRLAQQHLSVSEQG